MGTDADIIAGETEEAFWKGSFAAGHSLEAALKPHLSRVGFQGLPLAYATLGNAETRAMADQRGHAFGVAIEVRTRSSVKQEAAEGRKLASDIDEVVGDRPEPDPTANAVNTVIPAAPSNLYASSNRPPSGFRSNVSIL
jgi:hypothetical protein